MIGQRRKRVEDPRLLRGHGMYIADVKRSGMLYAVFLRSNVASANILTLDLHRTKAAPGVRAVWSGEELPSLPVLAQMEGMKVPPHHPLAPGKITYYGQPLAVVVADSLAQAQDALEDIEVELQVLAPVLDLERALEPGSPRVHPEFEDNVAYVWKMPGPPRKPLEGRVIRQRIRNQRLIPSALETRGVTAEWEREELTVWSSTQRPHLLKAQLCMALGLEEVRVVAPDVGGAFGSKVNVYGEEIVIAELARRLERPVQWIESRRENCTSTNHGRGQFADMEAQVSDDGRVEAIRCHIWTDVGAHHQLLSGAIPPLTAMMLSGAYKIASVDVTVTGVFTNKMATDAYRGAGKPEATFLIERMMDIIAREMHCDPVEVRRRNLIEQFPYPSAAGLYFDSGNYPKVLDTALQHLNYEHWRAMQKLPERKIGVGISLFVEMAGVGPSFIIPGGGWESAHVRIDRAGRVTVLTGTSPHGQGTHTVYAQLVQHTLGIPAEQVKVVHGDTARVADGIGTWGSRGTALGGSAVQGALAKVLEKAKRLASKMLGGHAELRDGLFLCDQARASWAEVANFAYDGAGLPEGDEPGLEAHCNFEPPNFTFPSGCHAVAVEVFPETGQWQILRYVAVDDCGRVVNPLLVDGQVHGGIAQGLGQVMFEEALYDDQGRLVTEELNVYPLPRAHDMPWIDTDLVQTPSPSNPMGFKGVGESGTVGAPAAVVNALADATNQRHLDMPVRPETLWKLLRK